MKYTHIYQRVEYPREGGYRMEAYALPDWMYLTVEQGKLTVHSRIHVNKEVRVGPVYSSAFSVRDIIEDLSGEISHRYLS